LSPSQPPPVPTFASRAATTVASAEVAALTEEVKEDAYLKRVAWSHSDLTSPVLSFAFSLDSKTLAVSGGMAYGLKEGGKMTGAMTLIPLK
jgi:hypothetical protein